jgi:hypothetical protein
MNIKNPYKLDEIDLSRIVYSQAKQTGKKKVILIKYKERNAQNNLVFQTPTLFNIHEPLMFTDNNIGYGEIDVALMCKNIQKSQKIIEFLNKLENKIKKDAEYYGSSWFNNTENNINFQKIIRSSDTYNEGTIKLKLLKNKNFETLVQLNNKDKVDINLLPAECYVKIILEIYALWINPNNDFGIFLRPILVSYTNDCEKDYNYDFIKK